MTNRFAAAANALTTDRRRAKRILAAVTAASIVLTACASPYADALKSATAACQATNDDAACRSAWNLEASDKQWHAVQNQRAGNIILGVLGAASVAAAAYNANRY